MNENALTDALRAFLADVVKDYRLPVKNGEPRQPQIFNGYLPPKRSGAMDDYPFVLVRPDSGSSTEEETEVVVSIIVGCFTEEFDGHEYCINIMQRIRKALMALPGGILANKFVLEFPFKWDNVPEQPYPLWQLDIETKWKFNTPEPEIIY